MENKKFNARYRIELGRYNLCSNEKQWLLTLDTSGGNLGELWCEDEKPDIDGLLPSEIMNLISGRLESRFINTRRKGIKDSIAAWNNDAYQYDLSWIKSKINSLEASINDLKERRDSILSELEDKLATENEK